MVLLAGLAVAMFLLFIMWQPWLGDMYAREIGLPFDGNAPRVHIRGRWTALPSNFQYSFIRRSKIEADNALRQRQDSKSLLSGPGPDYVAVSSVGFSRDQTKAMVSVHLRGGWSMEKWEWKEAKWHRAGTECTWDY